MTYRFAFISHYMDVSDYLVSGDGPDYRVSVRHAAHDDMRRYTRYTESEWKDLIVPTIGLMRKVGGDETSESVQAAFSAWHLKTRGTNPLDVEGDCRLTVSP